MDSRIVKNIMRQAVARLILAGLCIAGIPGLALAGALGDLAAQMQPGEWRVLNANGDSSGWSTSLLDAGGGNNVLQYADKGTWYPANKQFYFYGQGVHGSGTKFLKYDEATNKWTAEAKAYWDCTPTCDWGVGHGYQHNTIDPYNGNFYRRTFDSTNIFKYNIASKTWTQVPPPPVSDECCIGVEYFPDMGGLILAGGNGMVRFFNEKSSTWSLLASGLAMGGYHNVAVYNPVYKVVVFGGGNGSSDLYKIDASGKITKLANAPIEIAIAGSVFTMDPVSGKYLAFGANRTFYQYDLGTNVWTQLNASAVLAFPPTSGDNFNWFGTVAAPVSSYGVVMFLKFADADSKVYLYKHASLTPDTTPPATPKNVKGN
jgi:hypothetical protein